MKLPGFQKIAAIGDKRLGKLFHGKVFVEEKVDGSCFVFAKPSTEVYFRSKRAEVFAGTADKLFQPSIAHVLSVESLLESRYIYYTEALCRPKHNTLAYDHTPKGNLVLWDVYDLKMENFVTRGEKKDIASRLGIDVAPLIYTGTCSVSEDFSVWLNRMSFLGGSMIEGFVVKNYAQTHYFQDKEYPVTCGKFVSEKFKEVNGANWKKENTGKGKFEVMSEGYCTPARWHKAINHLREDGRLTETPQDIGPLLKEITSDITEEEKDNIKDKLWEIFGRDVLRVATRGFPEWYKEQLAAAQTF